MFPADFGYARAASVPHALGLLAEAQAAGEEAKFLAGGQSLLPLMKLRLAAPQFLIDLAGIDGLKGVQAWTAAAGTGVVAATLGALTTYRELERDTTVTGAVPALADALAVLADPQVRARGTVGGAVAHGDPAADLPPVLLALNAELTIASPAGTRTAPLDDFLRGVFTTDLAEDEIVTAISIRSTGARGSAYLKFPHPASHLPLAGVAAVVTMENGRIAQAEVAVTGISSRPYRARHTERTLASADPAPDLLAEAAAQVAEGITPLSDQHASGPYRVHLAQVLARRAIATAVKRAHSGTAQGGTALRGTEQRGTEQP
jgi:aerobic carbon-monoxide dehydrogenase medium subunit